MLGILDISFNRIILKFNSSNLSLIMEILIYGAINVILVEETWPGGNSRLGFSSEGDVN